MDGSSAGATVYEGFGGSFGRCPTRHEAVSRFTDVIRSGSNRATCPSLEVPCGVPRTTGWPTASPHLIINLSSIIVAQARTGLDGRSGWAIRFPPVKLGRLIGETRRGSCGWTIVYG